MDLSGFVKTLRVPADFMAPPQLRHEDLVARAISRDDLDADVAGINASVELIRRTRGGGWPEGPVTSDNNYVDLVWHELEMRENYSFAYAVYQRDEHYLGCCYLYPMGRRTPLTTELLHHDVDVSWWVTPDAYERGYYVKLYRALLSWATERFPFSAPYFSNLEIPGPPTDSVRS